MIRIAVAAVTGKEVDGAIEGDIYHKNARLFLWKFLQYKAARSLKFARPANWIHYEKAN